MTTHETIRQLLALSAAGLLDAADERRVHEHVHQCAECSTALDDLAAVSADLCRLPAPIAPPDLLARTEARVAAELAAQAGLRHGAILAVGAGLFAWMAALATWGLYRLLAGSAGWLEWLMLTTVPAYMAAGAVAAMFASRRRLERSLL
jgi:predicted anti-sigma-YlaC factor YlaD